MSEMTVAAADSADAAASRSKEADTPIELILARFQEVFCYKVPPQASAAGHRAEDWNLGEPRFTGRLHLVGVGSTLECRVLKQDGDDVPVAVCPVRTGADAAPVDAIVAAVADSSRYFVFRCEDAQGRRAYLGVGFRERDEAYDFKASMGDFIRGARREATAAVLRDEAAKAPVNDAPAVDMSLKGGLKLSFGDKASPSSSPARTANTAAVPKLAPPPVPKLAPPPATPDDEFSAFQDAPAAAEAPLEDAPAGAAPLEGWADFADAFPAT